MEIGTCTMCGGEALDINDDGVCAGCLELEGGALEGEETLGAGLGSDEEEV